MSTVTKEIAEIIIRQKGYYSDDERVLKVIKYENKWRGESYALLYARDVAANRYAASEYIINPQVIWDCATTGE